MPTDAGPTKVISAKDRQDLRTAVCLLENPGFAIRVADLIGAPIEAALKRLPESASTRVNAITESALRAVLDLAMRTMREGQVPASRRSHKAAAAASGAVGGAAGLAGLGIELPITTAIIFRSIADIARAEGEDLRHPKTCLACVEVFALGGPGSKDDAAESAYFATRVALAAAIRDAARFVARKTASVEAPMLVRLITKLAARFGIVVSWKSAAQLAPLVGAIGGAAVNTLFLDHFQDMAQGHFTVRRLERKYGKQFVRQAYLNELHGEDRPEFMPLDDALLVTHTVVDDDAGR